MALSLRTMTLQLILSQMVALYVQYHGIVGLPLMVVQVYLNRFSLRMFDFVKGQANTFAKQFVDDVVEFLPPIRQMWRRLGNNMSIHQAAVEAGGNADLRFYCTWLGTSIFLVRLAFYGRSPRHSSSRGIQNHIWCSFWNPLCCMVRFGYILHNVRQPDRRCPCTCEHKETAHGRKGLPHSTGQVSRLQRQS